MATRTVKVEGLKELNDALGQLPKAVARDVLKRTLLKAGAPMQRTAEALAPTRKDPNRTITFGPKGEKKVRERGTGKVLVQIGTRLSRRQASQNRKLGKAEVEVYIGTRDRVGRLEEFGTATAKATPFMRPAWDEHKDGALDAIKDSLGGEIEAGAARLAKRIARKAARG